MNLPDILRDIGIVLALVAIVWFVVSGHFSTLKNDVQKMIDERKPSGGASPQPAGAVDHPAVISAALQGAARVVAAAAPAPAGVVLTAAPAGPDGIDTPSGFAAFKDYPNIQALIFKAGRGLTPEEIARWQAATGGKDPTYVPPATGTLDTSLLWKADDGHNGYADFEPGKPVTATVNLPTFALAWYQTGGSTPTMMEVSATDAAGNAVGTVEQGAGNGGSVTVSGARVPVTVTFTSPIATRWGFGVKPA